METYQADVLAIGGGPAGAWAALTARAHGAERVVLVDKGYCGSSGATASANTGVWCVAPEGDVMCELYCPADALYVSPLADQHVHVTEAELQTKLGSYSREMGWRADKPHGADRDPTFRFRRAARGL